MPFQLVAYDKLKSSIEESITTVIKHHKLDPDNRDESINNLPDPTRIIQIKFLMRTMSLLDKIEDTSAERTLQNARILNAAVYFVCKQIELTYTRSPDNSKLYSTLTTSLNLDTENLPNRLNKLTMYNSLAKFLRANTYNEANPSKGYLPKQPYNIPGYVVKNDIKDLSTQVHQFKMELLDEAEAQQLEKAKSAKKTVASGLGLLSGFGAMFGSQSSVATKKGKSKLEQKEGVAKKPDEKQEGKKAEGKRAAGKKQDEKPVGAKPDEKPDVVEVAEESVAAAP
jgi:hypothetical protein